MASFEQYANKYQTARMERRSGILQLTLHTDGGPLLLSACHAQSHTHARGPSTWKSGPSFAGFPPSLVVSTFRLDRLFTRAVPCPGGPIKGLYVGYPPDRGPYKFW